MHNYTCNGRKCELLQTTHTDGIYLTYQIYFNHKIYYFCQLVFNSDNWFQRRRIKFIIYVYHVFDGSNISFFVEGHTETISAKLF